MRRLTMGLGLGLGLAVLAIATPAHAATLSRSGTTLTYQAAAGEENIPTVGSLADNITIDDGYDIATGAGCGDGSGDGEKRVREGRHHLGDPSPGRPRRRDEDRRPRVQFDLPPGVKFQVNGGSGKDRLIGTKGKDMLSGGSGADNVYGSGGKDKLIGGPGNDRLTGFGRLDGGSGNDFLEAFSGFAGEKKPYPSTILGGPGNGHVLAGNKKPDFVNCGAGKDVATTTDRRGRDTFKNC